jgi:hypothetical protein
MDSDDYKQKRERNNRSVQKCRSNEKKKIETAKKKLEYYKKEEKELEEKYTILKKELQVLKSLFTSSINDQNDEKSTEINQPKDSITVINPSTSNGTKNLNLKRKNEDYKTLNSLLNAEQQTESSENKNVNNINLPKDHEYALRKKISKRL